METQPIGPASSMKTRGDPGKTSVDTLDEEPLPDISIEWRLDPTTHSFSRNSTPPTLCLILTSHDKRPITIYDESLSPGHLLAEGKFSIFYHTTNAHVARSKSRFCHFEPPSKIEVPLRESLFHTLYPEVPVVFSTVFGRSNKAPKPALRAEEANVDVKQYPHRPGRGVDGLEPNHHYCLRAERGWGYIRWWEYGEKDEVMNPPSGRLDGRTVAYRRSKNPHRGIQLEVQSLPDIDFWCVE
ncbi:MAG: hypothetical protein Q9164_001942 [Protoblastenia rupestris]